MALIDRLPLFYKDSKEVMNIQETLEGERIELEKKIQALINDLFIITSENVSNWEEFLGILIDDSKDINFRREKIKANIIGTGTFNKKLVNNILDQFKNAAAEVREYNETHSFIIKFNNEYTVPNKDVIQEIINIMEVIKPAHLYFNYTFTYNWWDRKEFKSKTWEEFSTWNDLRDYKEKDKSKTWEELSIWNDLEEYKGE